MGYETSFVGSFDLDHSLSPKRLAYLKRFSETRRMKRNALNASRLPDPIRIAARLPIGDGDAQYFVGGADSAGQGLDPSVVDCNAPPFGQPGLWCGWTPADNGQAIVWNELEKFYYYVEWMEYLIRHFLKPWGYVVNGKVRWDGEDSGDSGVIHARNNIIQAAPDVLMSPDPKWGDRAE